MSEAVVIVTGGDKTRSRRQLPRQSHAAARRVGAQPLTAAALLGLR
jgi:hypothetical protein